MTWPVARDYCRTHHTDLASVRNDEENQMIRELVGDQGVWVGLSGDSFEWSDQTYSSFRYWKAGKRYTAAGNGECVHLLKSQSGRWEKQSCENTHPFLCVNCE